MLDWLTGFPFSGKRVTEVEHDEGAGLVAARTYGPAEGEGVAVSITVLQHIVSAGDWIGAIECLCRMPVNHILLAEDMAPRWRLRSWCWYPRPPEMYIDVFKWNGFRLVSRTDIDALLEPQPEDVRLVGMVMERSA